MIQKFLFADIHLSSPNYLRCTGNKRCISCCFSRVWELVASFYLLQDFLQDFLQESFPSNKREASQDTSWENMFWKQCGQLLTKMSCWLAIAHTTPWVMGLFPPKAQNLSLAFIFSPVLWYISSYQRQALCLSFSDTWQCSFQFHVRQRVQKPGINCFTSKGHGNCKNRK